MGDGRSTMRIDRVNAVERIIVRWSQQISHARIGDDEFLASAALPVKHSRQQNACVSDEKPPRLQNDLEPGTANNRRNHVAELLHVYRPLRSVVSHRQATTDVEVLEFDGRRLLDLTAEMQESLQTHLVRRELRDLRADMHVESNQPQMRQRSDNLRHRQRLVKRNPELHSLLTGARVGMRRLDEQLRIDPQRNSRLYTDSTGDRVEDVDFLLRFNG